MKVKELIEKLKEFDGELEVITYSDYNDYGTGTIERIRLNDEETDTQDVIIDFEYDGEI